MAKPRYIICAHDRIVDHATGLVSHINVVDRIIVSAQSQRIPEGASVIVPETELFGFVMTSVWIRDDEEGPEDDYNFEVLIHYPDGRSKAGASGKFRFSKMFHRIDLGVRFTTHSNIVNGRLVIESRIQKQGSEGWLSQSF